MQGLSPSDHEYQILGLPVTLHKMALIDRHGNVVVDENGEKVYRCGFRIGGGIDQDSSLSPQGYADKGVYITHVEAGGAADVCGLKLHDKILQVNGMDFTTVTHEMACKIIKTFAVLNMVVYRRANSYTTYPLDCKSLSNKPTNTISSKPSFQTKEHR